MLQKVHRMQSLSSTQMVELSCLTAVNVLRMIKLFGWEHRMSERIRGKRNEELGWLWKLKVGEITFSVFMSVLISYNQVLETLNGIIK